MGNDVEKKKEVETFTNAELQVAINTLFAYMSEKWFRKGMSRDDIFSHHLDDLLSEQVRRATFVLRITNDFAWRN